MAESTALAAQAGVPWAQRIRVTDGQNIWGTLGLFEVRMQVRSGGSENYPLLADLTEFLTVSYDSNDIIIDIALTGEDTRTLRSGHYDILASDVGVTDASALRLLYGRLTVAPVITAAL